MRERHERYLKALRHAESVGGNIIGYADRYKYFGFQRDEDAAGWWFREWLPRAGEVYIFGDFNNWERHSFPLLREEGGVWSIFLSDADLHGGLRRGTKYKLLICSDNGCHERIPAYAKRVVQDDSTKDFAAEFWEEDFDWGDDTFDMASNKTLYIYESHIGMAVEEKRVGSYAEYMENVLPEIAKSGYNTIQLMGIAEHPYYGSYGYHVANFYAPSSRFGLPEDLKRLIKRAHEYGIGVIMDLVHSHYVKNTNEGINGLDGDESQYSPAGEAGNHPYWDSKLFDYGKEEVRRFLLSNIRYWMEEFRFDGFRFDGVGSMIYRHHAYRDSYSREDYFNDEVEDEAITYLTLANKLIHEINPSAASIAEEVSGMPGICIPTSDGGIGFDYRLGMAVADFWIKMLKDVPDENWDIWDIWNVLTDRLPWVRTIAYCESHDQAMVGDQTLAFRLMGASMYSEMSISQKSVATDRGIALHKMIRLITISLGGEGYLNFMGNEYGHPDWIDFPREGNGWSYEHARRQWSLRNRDDLKYKWLNNFDRDMLFMVEQEGIMRNGFARNLQMDRDSKTMVYCHDNIIFVFNWHPSKNIDQYKVSVPMTGLYEEILNTDNEKYGGSTKKRKLYYSINSDNNGIKSCYINIYNKCRSAIVLKLLT